MRRGKTFHCEQCGGEFYRNPTYIRTMEARGNKIRYCSGKCYSAACKSGAFKRPGPRPNRRLGEELQCTVCGKSFYRKRSQIARGVHKTCGDPECISQSLKGGNNPFWGKGHTTEVRAYISKIRSARESGKRVYGPLKGTFTQTPEARAKMSKALRQRWAENRDIMLARFQRPPKPREEQRHRKAFTPWQRKNWKDEKCCWCGATKQLVLDHIISVRDGGVNVRENAQTLCQPCNIWKMVYVDRSLHLARLALQAAQ